MQYKPKTRHLANVISAQHQYAAGSAASDRKSRNIRDKIADVIYGVFRQLRRFCSSRRLVCRVDDDQYRPLGHCRLRPFSYGLLTMIVSLEAIFLSTFVTHPVRIAWPLSRIQRADLDYKINLLVSTITHSQIGRCNGR